MTGVTLAAFQRKRGFVSIYSSVECITTSKDTLKFKGKKFNVQRLVSEPRPVQPRKNLFR
jgi:hypothetical protein